MKSLKSLRRARVGDGTGPEPARGPPPLQGRRLEEPAGCAGVRLGPSPICLGPPRTRAPAVPLRPGLPLPDIWGVAQVLCQMLKCHGHNPYPAFKTCLRLLCLQETPGPLRSPALAFRRAPCTWHFPVTALKTLSCDCLCPERKDPGQATPGRSAGPGALTSNESPAQLRGAQGCWGAGHGTGIGAATWHSPWCHTAGQGRGWGQTGPPPPLCQPPSAPST